MAENIVISAIARVIDEATPALKGIVQAITGVGDSAKESGGLFGKLGADIKGAFGQIGGTLGEAGSAIGRFGSQLGQLAGPLAGLTGLAGLGGMTAAVTSFISTARDLDRTARLLGVTTDALQAFRYAAGNADVADTALTRLRQTLVTLGKDSKQAQPTIELLGKMGVSIDQIREGRLEEILPKIVRGFEANIDPMKQAEAGIALFGKQWRDVLPFLQKGTEGLAAGAEKARELGIAAKDIAAAKEAGAALKALGDAVESAKNQFAAALLPVFTPMIQWIADFVKNNKELLAQVALPAFIGAIAAAVGSLGVAIAGALGPWGLAAAAIIAIATAVYSNWKPAMEWMEKNFPETMNVVKATWEAGKEVVTGYVSFVLDSWKRVVDGFKEGGIIGALEGVWESYKIGWTSAFEYVNRKIDFKNLVAAINDIDWNQVGQTIGQALGNALKAAWTGFVRIGEWIESIDWATVGNNVGKFLVDAIIATFQALFTIDQWVSQMMQKAVTGAAETDWGAVAVAIANFFNNLVGKMIEIGANLIGGLINGMLSAIGTSMGQVSAAIGEKLGGIKLPFGSSLADIGIGRRAAANENVAPNLLQRGGAAGAANSNVNTNINLTGVPAGMNANVSQTQSGPPVNASVEVGRAGVGGAAG